MKRHLLAKFPWKNRCNRENLYCYIKLRKHYEEDFKKQIAEIFNQENYTYRKLGEEYKIAPSTIRGWLNRYNKSKSFDIDDKRTEGEKELIKLRKKVRRLKWRMTF